MNTIDSQQFINIFKKKHPVILWLDDERNPNDIFPFPFFDHEPDEYRPIWVEVVVGKYKGKTPNEWDVVWVKNYDEFKTYVDSNQIPDIVCFDHDLGGQLTGKDCANYLIEKLMDLDKIGPIVRSQSANPGGASNILNLFSNWRKHYIKEHPEQFE